MIKKPKTNQLQQEITDLTNKWKRACADYANLEKRVEREKQEFIKFSSALLLTQLLVVLDDLERAEQHLKDKGLSLALDKLRELIKSEGLTEIPVLGKPFDPGMMECSEMIAGEKNKVMSVVQKGYLLNQKVFRPAKVKVGSHLKS